MSELAYASVIVGVQWLITAWHIYITWLERSLHRRTTERPEHVAEIIAQDAYRKARLYSMDRLAFKIFSDVVEASITTAFLLLGYYKYLWSVSESWCSYPVALFLALHYSINLLLELPLQLHENFVVEEKHGFNKYTLGFFLVDKVKKVVLSFAVSLPLMAAAVWLIDNSGPFFFLYVWVLASFFIFLMLTVYPSLIAPLFDKYIPLPDGTLKEEIEKLAASRRFPLTKLFVVDGSKRSAHSNAYMYGFWKNKRIVLFDTLLSGIERKKVREAMGCERTDEEDKKGMQVEEVVGVLAHELGHWEKWHTVWQLFIVEANILFTLFSFSLFHKSAMVEKAFFFPHLSMPSLISLLVVMTYVMSIYSELFSFVCVCLTRRMEFSADAYAASLGYASPLKSALIKLSNDNLSMPINHPLYSTYNFTHPPVSERIAAISKKE